MLSCGVVCCGECYHLFMFGNGFPSRFDHFSFVASLSFRVWPAEVHRITGAGRQSATSKMRELNRGKIHKNQRRHVFQRLVHTHRLVLKKRLLSLCHHRASMGSKSFCPGSQSVFKFSRCILPLRYTLPLLCFLRLLS